MNKELNFETLKYFLECYFNESANYDELDKILNEFNLYENTNYHKKLSEELRLILQLQNWDVVQGVIKKYGMRKMSEGKVKWFIHSVLDKLEDN